MQKEKNREGISSDKVITGGWVRKEKREKEYKGKPGGEIGEN
jgi:hypothetical protein